MLPQGRLTLTTAVPVLTSTVTAATTIYYTPYNGNQVPLYDGADLVATQFAELSQATTDSTKSPAAVTTDSNYDLFVWSDGGTIRCTRGPAWSSATARGTGAGTTELERVSGLLLNKISITNGPAAQRGTYVGTVRSDASSQINFYCGGADTAAVLGVWNAFNRVDVAALVTDTTNSFTMTSNAVRSWNNSTNYRVSFVSGLAEDMFLANGRGNLITANTIHNAGMGIGYDSTSAISGIMATYSSTGSIGASVSSFSVTALGFHFIQALEVSQGGAGTGYGDNGVPTFMQSGLSFRFRM